MTNELRVRKSPHGSLVVYEMRSPLSVGWRVIHVGHGDAPRLGVGYWVTEQEAALWQVARFGPDPARVALDEPLKDDPSTLNSDAGDARKLCTCSETHDVATGYGVLRCDLRHPHPGLNHHDPRHRLWWGPAEAVPRAH